VKSSELRRLFLDFFRSKGHEFKPSWPLIPEDPTLLFTVAGMVPFKNYFLGKAKAAFTRATTSQKCIRTNDIDNVGRTRRHNTFFEMLGNFSFGDYFKKDAIAYAWEFLTEVVKIPKDRMYITVYKTDEEAIRIWKDVAKVPSDRIFKLGEATNFWEMGTTGPCGYCSEIYYDLTGEGGEVTASDIENNDDRFLEIWNLVFMEFNKQSDGKLVELEKKNIDTGMGLERLSAVSQGFSSNFESDLFFPIIKFVSEKCGIPYKKSEKTDISLRVIADHARGVTFLTGDGVLPSNEGRGYVLRRIIRRAVRHCRMLGIKEVFLHTVIPVVLDIMGEAYPEVVNRKDYISQIIRLEEEKFNETMDKGLDILNAEIEKLKASGKEVLPGETAFKLYDTYGFPLEITEEILLESRMSADREIFKACMEKQRETAKKAWKSMDSGITSVMPKQAIDACSVTDFRGYDSMSEHKCRVLAISEGSSEVNEASKEAAVILDRTPFYAESGGQAADRGVFTWDNGRAEVFDTQKTDGRFIHYIKIISGTLKKNTEVTACVNETARAATMKNHTCTHLLHAALRAILGPHVEQAGSYVGPDRLRFDFTHFAHISREELKKAEAMINEWVQQGIDVLIREMGLNEARAMGAMALFDEKYGDTVRTVTVGGVSIELCAGTHLKNTGEAGLFKIISSGATAAGVRRIEAVTGMEALRLFDELDDFALELKDHFKAPDTRAVMEKVRKQTAELKAAEKKIEDMKRAEVMGNAESYLKNALEINGIKFIPIMLESADKNSIRELADLLRKKAKASVILISNTADARVAFLCAVTDDLTARADASKIVKAASAITGGGGGGRRDMAEAGGKDASKLAEAFKAAEKALEEIKK